MSEESVRIVTDFQTLPKPPKPTAWDYVKFYLFNFFRKPMVMRKQKYLVHLFNEVKNDLDTRIVPVLKKNRCLQCTEACGYLQGQVFMSQMKTILEALSKDQEHKHASIFDIFLRSHKDSFEKSENTSRWINNL